MRHAVRLSLALLLVLMARTGEGQGPPPGCSKESPLPPPPTPLNFPAGFDYPAPDLQAAVNAKNVHRIRTHGWNLWAGINTLGTNGRPLWWSWLTSTYGYAPPPSTKPGAVQMMPSHSRTLNQINHDNTPVQLPSPIYPTPNYVVKYFPFTSQGIPDGVQFQSNGDIMVAGVIYNKDAYNWLRNPASAPIFEASTLTTQLKKGQKLVSPFPSSSIVLKHMYWPVRGDGPTALPVYDPAVAPKQPTYYGYELWPEVVGLDPSGHIKPGQKTTVSYFYGIQTAGKTPLPTKTSTVTVVPLQDFYFQKIDGPTLAKMTCQDRALLDASALWLYNRPFHDGDYLVSVSMHIITKEINDWTLQSFWWSPRPNDGPYATDRPDIPPSTAPGPWRHYLQTTEYGITNPDGKTYPAVYNPYIELAAAHPINTNCRNCHTRAAWPRNGVLPAPQPYGQYQLTDIAKDPGLLAVIPNSSPIFNGLMRVDFQWALSDRAIPVK
jgi:hypothetical protein